MLIIIKFSPYHFRSHRDMINLGQFDNITPNLIFTKDCTGDYLGDYPEDVNYIYDVDLDEKFNIGNVVPEFVFVQKIEKADCDYLFLIIDCDGTLHYHHNGKTNKIVQNLSFKMIKSRYQTLLISQKYDIIEIGVSVLDNISLECKKYQQKFWMN